jgi:hypothetical protein
MNAHLSPVSKEPTLAPPGAGIPAVEAQTSPTVLDDYRAVVARFDRRMAEDIADRRSRAAHTHPWLGPLTAKQWLCLSAAHQRQHRKQIRAILEHGATAG